jgi:hypothetical protein
MKIWKIDDGAYHWVVAKDTAQAFGLYFENLSKLAGNGWPKDELENLADEPTIQALDPEEKFTFRPFGDERKMDAQVGEWLGVFEEPRYLACSEF